MTGVLTTCACSTLEYYANSIHGHLEILNKRKPIETIINDGETDTWTKDKLDFVLQIRKFAIENLDLPDNGSYLDYVDLKRKYVVWNVFATPAYSIQPLSWCFLIAGCLNYKGFYSLSDAESFAESMKEKDLDLYIGGVRAYSTLGWFDDPILNTMLDYENLNIAKLIFHELAHQKIYFLNDTEFNEAFAETIAIIGTYRWLELYGTQKLLEVFESRQSHDEQFDNLVLTYRNKLDALYQRDLDILAMEIQKQQIFKSMHNDYKRLQKKWQNDMRYDVWFEGDLNNAKLAAVVTYRKLIPDFMQIYNQLNQNIPAFYSFIQGLELCTDQQRRIILLKNNLNYQC